MEDVDNVLRVYHTAITNGELEIGETEKFNQLLQKHRQNSQTALL